MIKNPAAALAVCCAAAWISCDETSEPPGLQGVVELDERVLSFEVPGRVTAVSARRGAQVTTTDVLATLDDTQARTSTAAREAEAVAAEERAKVVGAGGRVEEIRALEAQLRSAEATERLAAKRRDEDRGLVGRGAIARSVLDDSEARATSATSEREALQQRLRELRTGARREEVAGAQAQASAATAVAKLEADRVDRYQLRPLQAGEVLDVHVETGEVVAAGTPVVTIGDTAHPYIDVFVPQEDIAGVRVGARATIRVDSMRQTFTGVVEHVARRTEFTPRYLFSDRERSNLVVRTRVRVEDPGRLLHAGVPSRVTIAPGTTANR
jgi:HlyD family secretion protein